ncbi:hypothetical protein [Saccharothrix sp. Mg75]|uniref:hypothetical protein n=1 Tax=Saccharothrix sp. Mg75 TaxID=3445357 RepID=UPI003EE93954
MTTSIKRLIATTTFAVAAIGSATGPALATGSGTDGRDFSASGDVSVAGYETCTWGKACLYEGLDGTGRRWEVPGCGWNDIPWWDHGGVRNLVTSVRTHGNGITLVDDDQNGAVTGSVGPWGKTNLAGWENDRADRVFVTC